METDKEDTVLNVKKPFDQIEKWECFPYELV